MNSHRLPYGRLESSFTTRLTLCPGFGVETLGHQPVIRSLDILMHINHIVAAYPRRGLQEFVAMPPSRQRIAAKGSPWPPRKE